MTARRNNKPNPAREAAAWNDAHPIGTEVTLMLDHGGMIYTRTRAAAVVLSGHTAVIWLEGRSGCYALDRVRPFRVAS